MMAGVDPQMVVGVTTEVIAGEGKILTAGGLDTHIHFICPQQAHEAIKCREYAAAERIWTQAIELYPAGAAPDPGFLPKTAIGSFCELLSLGRAS